MMEALKALLAQAGQIEVTSCKPVFEGETLVIARGIFKGDPQKFMTVAADFAPALSKSGDGFKFSVMFDPAKLPAPKTQRKEDK